MNKAIITLYKIILKENKGHYYKLAIKSLVTHLYRSIEIKI